MVRDVAREDAAFDGHLATVVDLGVLVDFRHLTKTLAQFLWSCDRYQYSGRNERYKIRENLRGDKALARINGAHEELKLSETEIIYEDQGRL